MTVTLGPQELQAKLGTGETVIMLDVRTSAEYETRHIPGSVLVPLAALSGRCSELGDLPGTVVLVCESGVRSEEACQKLAATGCGNAQVLDGGIMSWAEINGDLIYGEARWAMDRQVRLTAGSLVVLGVLLDFVVPGLRFLALFVGAGLVFSAVTNTCTMALGLAKLPYNRGPVTDPDATIAKLRKGLELSA